VDIYVKTNLNNLEMKLFCMDHLLLARTL